MRRHDWWLPFVGCWIGGGSGLGLILSDGHPITILAVLLLAAVTLFTAMEVYVWQVFR